MPRRLIILALIVLLSSGLAPLLWSQAAGAATKRVTRDVKTVSPDSGRVQLPPRWWEKASAIRSFSLLKNSRRQILPLRDAAKLEALLGDVREQGFSAISISAPADGGTGYGGLDFKNHYAIRPEAGTMDEFRRMVRMAHSHGLAVTISYNLGYSSVDAPFWLKASDDVRAGRDSKESRWFVWSTRRDAPPPAGNTFFNPPGRGFWEYSQRAGRYFWSRWGGVDDAGNDVRLPGAPEFQEEAERIVRFWMETGIDGIMMDAVTWYSNIDWDMNRRRVTGVMASYGNAFMQPEGAGGLGEDPVPWITEGGWNCVQDYGLGIWWVAGSNVILKAFQTGDPRPIETALRTYHDRVVAVGGILYSSVPPLDDPVVAGRTEAQHLAAATIIGLGDLLSVETEPDAEFRRLLRLKSVHPALQQLSTRRPIPTNGDDRFYALLRTSPDRSERILVVLNYRRGFQTIDVDLSGISGAGLIELKTGEEIPWQNSVRVNVYSYGYRFYQILPAAPLTGGSAKAQQDRTRE